MNQPALGQHLAALIEKAGYPTPTAFARALGSDPSVIHNWVKGKSKPSAAMARKAAPLLDVLPSDLLDHAPAPPDDYLDTRTMPPLIVQAAWLVGDDTPLPDTERATCEAMLGKVVAMFLPTWANR